MARPRKPTETLKNSGAFAKNPGRTRKDPPSSGPFGDIPASLPEQFHDTWRELAAEVPLGVLQRSDRAAFEDMVRLKWERRYGEDWKASQQANLNWFYSHFAMTPSDRSKVTVADDEEPTDPAEKYFN